MSFSIEPFIQIMLILFLLLLASPTCQLPLDALTPNQPVRDGDVLVSSRKIFALGFFSPGNSQHRYVGVWYNNVPNQTVVWVANRDNPVNDSSAVLSINGNGGLVIHGNDSSNPLWSANVTLSSPNNSTAKLLDTGNLVLLENESQRLIWQGFDYPSNILLPYMKLGYNRRSRMNWLLTTWKSQDDPGTGNCSYGISPTGLPQLVLHQGGAPRYRTLIGFYTGKLWRGSVSYINNEDEVSIMYVPDNESALTARTTLDESGILERSAWNDRVHEWNMYWSAPVERCDMYGQCGPNGNCNPYDVDAIHCTCLPGYEPKSLDGWYDWYWKGASGGCLRRNGGVSMCGNGEGFVKVKRVKIPDLSKASFDMNLNLKECEQVCLKNCSCMAYSSSDEGSGCVTWPGDLMDIRTLADAGQVLYVRVDAIVLAQYAKKSNDLSTKGKVTVSLASVLVLFLVFSLVVWLVRRKRNGTRRQNEFIFGHSIGSYQGQSSGRTNVDDTRPDLPFFDLTTVAAATNNFSIENKLGTGGFGSVYKGVLSNGKEIAVKRLSQNSCQGTEEFKNEVLLISKLQHRNLVRILGCCVQDEEKMIIYEYLPNKSLDFFIFNESNKADLDWTRRFEIICGIVRGILYLHQDSRLRIIHRDLKASNILLDASMNPKIADFGMARIFRGDQNEANTNRVVGTYGYMSPEYALRRRFSVKSDVYSFGVLLLEIITGRKNRVYYQEESPDSNLVGHVWNLWLESNALEVVDPSLGESYPRNEVLRCIHIALLCVQEYAIDRPTMSAVLNMLGNDAALPSPRQSAFLLQRNATSGDSSTKDGADSVNDVTCTVVEAR
ncbi:hypothetical protein ACLB2K_024278 [Fragaria x ananassa]